MNYIIVRCFSQLKNNGYYIKIYDENDNLIKEAHTYDKYVFYGKKDKIYIVKVTNNQETIIAANYLKNNNIDFIFKKLVTRKTFLLKDKNYLGLKIKGGKLILWQNHIQLT